MFTTRTRVLSRAILRDFLADNLPARTLGSILRAVKKPYRASLNVLEAPGDTICTTTAPSSIAMSISGGSAVSVEVFSMHFTRSDVWPSLNLLAHVRDGGHG